MASKRTPLEIFSSCRKLARWQSSAGVETLKSRPRAKRKAAPVPPASVLKAGLEEA